MIKPFRVFSHWLSFQHIYLPPCWIGSATDYHRFSSIMGLSPLRGSLRAAPRNRGTEVSLYPTSPSWRTTAPHGCLVSLLIARSHWEVMAAEDKSLREKRKDPQHWLFSFQGAVKETFVCPFTLQRTFRSKKSRSRLKLFEIFSCLTSNDLDGLVNTLRTVAVLSSKLFTSHSLFHAAAIYFLLITA